MESRFRFVHELMTRHPVTLSSDVSLLVARDVMQIARIRHIPIVDEAGQIEGILSDRDLGCRALRRAYGIDEMTERETLSRTKAHDVMSKRVHTTTPDCLLGDAARQMNRRRISCLPVIENEIAVGVIAERDFVVALIHDDKTLGRELEPESGDEANSDWQSLEAEYDRLRTIRDELRLQLGLATLEAKGAFEQAESRWRDLESRLAQHCEDSGESLEHAARIGENFVKETRALYDELRRSILRR